MTGLTESCYQAFGSMIELGRKKVLQGCMYHINVSRGLPAFLAEVASVRRSAIALKRRSIRAE